MTKLVKPALNNVNNISPKIYAYNEGIKNVNTKPQAQTVIDYSNINYNQNIADIYTATASAKTGGFVSKLYSYITKELSIKFNNSIDAIEGKIESFLKKFNIFDSSSSSDNKEHDKYFDYDNSKSGIDTPGVKAQRDDLNESVKKNLPQPGDDDFIGPVLPKDEQKTEDSITEESTTKAPKKEEPITKKDEESVKEEPKKEEKTPVTNPKNNSELTQTLMNTRGNLVTGDGIDTTIRTDCKSYDVGGNTNANHNAQDGQLSAKEREMLIYLAWHETGGDPTQATAVMSSYMNGWEKSGYSFNKYLAEACSKWSSGDEFAQATQSYRSGTYTYNDITSMKKYNEMKNAGHYDTLSACADNVLSGTRNVNATQWVGGYHNNQGQLVDKFHTPV